MPVTSFLCPHVSPRLSQLAVKSAQTASKTKQLPMAPVTAPACSELHGQELLAGSKSADQRSGPEEGFDCH